MSIEHIYNIRRIMANHNTLINKIQNIIDIPLNSVDIIKYKVSVLLPTFNNEQTIFNAIYSVITQSHNNIELIIIDDASTDNTLNIIKQIEIDIKRCKLECNLYSFKILHNNINVGKFVSLNKGLQIATGTYISILDGDDYFLYNKIELQIDNLLEFPKLVGNSHLFNRIKINDSNINKIKIDTNTNGLNMLFYKKAIIKKIGYYDSIRFGGDNEFYNRIINVYGSCSIYFIDRVLYIASNRNNSLTTNIDTGYKSIARKSYEDEFTNWHNSKANKYMSYPLKKRPFDIKFIQSPNYIL